jgi:hypothetical protein
MAHLSNHIEHTGYCKELNLSNCLMFHMTYRYLIKSVDNTITPILSWETDDKHTYRPNVSVECVCVQHGQTCRIHHITPLIFPVLLNGNTSRSPYNKAN